MAASAEDEIFASLGNSLMHDLLSDIKHDSETQLRSANDDSILNTLSVLEKELDETTTTKETKTTSSGPPPPGLAAAPPPGLKSASAGAMVVDHASTTHDIFPKARTTETTNDDAWDQALSQFSALSLTEEFLKADSARKQRMKHNIIADTEREKITADIVDCLFEGEDGEEYDIKEGLTLTGNSSSGKAMASFFPGLKEVVNDPEPEKEQAMMHTPVVVESPVLNTSSNVSTTPKQQPPSQHQGPIMSNVGLIPSPLPPHIMHAQGTLINPPHHSPGFLSPPHMHLSRINMPPHVAVPFPSPGNNIIPPLPPGHHLPQPSLIQQQQAHIDNMAAKQIQHTTGTSLNNETTLNENDFPALGVEKEELNEEEIKSKETITPQTKASPLNNVSSRITFQNPSPSAQPIPATAIHCTSMTPRDLCYVLHSIMRPLSALDPYNADYYRWSYDDRKSRNLLFVGGVPPVMALNKLPNPVWKETKVKAREINDTFRENVEKRAANWSKEKHILGKTVKNDVNRPKALLAATTLSTVPEGKGKLDESSLASASKEERQRANLWAARLASDKGYLAYLNLVELRRLLQSRGVDALDLNGERREDLLIDVEANVSKLNWAFGVGKVQNKTDVDDKVLSRTLSLPKGRMLLSRTLDEGILPHPSACQVLPSVVKIILKSSLLVVDSSVVLPAGEDRLLRSLSGLVRTVQPSVDPINIMKCLGNVNDVKGEIDEEKLDIKKVLKGKQALMELLHAVVSRGAEICGVVGGEYEDEWEIKEADFLAMLSVT